MRCSYSCGVDRHSDFLQEQILAFRLLCSEDKGAGQEPDECNSPEARCEREK